MIGSLLYGQTKSIESTSLDKTILEAEGEVFYDDNIQRLIATPNAKLQSADILLTAERIEYDQINGNVYASGKVIFSDGFIRVLAREVSINLGTGDFNASEVKSGFYPWFIHSNEIKREDSKINGFESTIYFLNKETGEPNLQFENIFFDQSKLFFQANKARFRIGDYSVLRLPPFSGKARKNNLNYNFTAGQKTNLGWYLKTGKKWSLNSF